MKIGVVILNWNGKKLLQQFLPSVIEHSGDATIYVADNASTDDSVATVIKEFPQVKIIENHENKGYAGGYNLALESVPEDIFILLNSDVEVTRDWLIPIRETFLSKPEVAAVQPKILDFKNRDKFEYAGAAGGYIDKYGYPYCRGRIFDEIEKDQGQYNDNPYIFWASGACLAIRRDIFFKTGGFDEDFFAHQEEIDLCWRIQNLGYRIQFVSESCVFHVGGATLNTLNPKKTYYNFRNSLFLLLKNLEKRNLYKILFYRMILDGVAAFRFIIDGKFRHFYAILKAHLSFYRYYGRMKKKRPNSFIINKYYEISSIVYQHFILKKHRYSELEK
jgi:GT2 family glycosyltransferase